MAAGKAWRDGSQQWEHVGEGVDITVDPEAEQAARP